VEDDMESNLIISLVQAFGPTTTVLLIVVLMLIRERRNNKGESDNPGLLTLIHDELKAQSKTLQEIRDTVRDHAKDAKAPFKKIMEDS